MLAKAATVRPVIAPSEPPVTMASATPWRIMLNDSPIAWADEAQAETVAKLGPLSPYRMETSPAAISGMNIGTKNGETRSGPLVR